MKQNLNIIIILIIASFSLSIGGHLTITPIGADESTRSEKRLFTVVDAVTRLELVEPARSSDFKFSPDKSHFITVTRQGNLKSGFNDFKLLLYNTDIVIDYINNEEKKIANLSTLLLLFSSSSNKDAISDIRWMPDNETLVFIGETTERPIAQIYSLNIFSKELHQLTDHPKAIVSYDINDAGDIIFNAGVPVPDETYGKISYVVGIMSMDRRQMKICNPKDIYENNEHPILSQAFFLQHGDSGQAVPIGQPFYGFSHGLALSNNGRWAIDTRFNSRIPREWMEGYFPMQNKGWLQHNIKNFDPNTMREPRYNGTRFVLLDISSKTERQLFDAPTGNYFGGYGSDVKIMKDNKSIILGNTFLPLNISASKERERRRNSTFTVEYNIETKEILIIAEHVIQPGESFADEPYSGLTFQSDGTLNLSQGRGEQQYLKKFRKQNGKWRLLEKLDKSNYLSLDKISKSNRLELSIRQDLNTSPEIFAKDNKSEKERQLTDLNPTFRQIKFGKVEQFNWEDKSGKTINGGLVYPPDFESGKRYPLVIQTHGFNPNEFLIEGPYPGAFAAQAFAAKDIMVLQVPGLGDNPERRKALRSAVESAIDVLDERELINRNKVGLIGFSNTGHAVQHIITFSEYNFATATIADAFSNSLMGYLGDFGYNMPEIERVNQGAVPWGERLAEWLNKDHTFNLERVRTPLRLDEYTAMYVWWDVYAILRRLQKPVEWVVYPGGHHWLMKPLQRLAAQEGSVDWFTFWLKGEEDSDPEKVEQYKRWHKFRKQHEADLEKPRPALLNITTTPVVNPK